MKGRKPKPEALAALHGNPSKRALPTGAKPKAAPDLTPPSHLNAVAKAEWDRVTAELRAVGMITAIDRAALGAYCATYARWAKAEERIAAGAELVVTPNKSVQQSPWVGIANRALELMHRYLTEFGMTPASRVRLSIQAPALPPLPESSAGADTAPEESFDQYLDGPKPTHH